MSLSLAAFLESDSQAANSHEARRDGTSDTVLQRVAPGPQAVLVTGQPPTPTPPCPPYTFLWLRSLHDRQIWDVVLHSASTDLNPDPSLTLAALNCVIHKLVIYWQKHRNSYSLVSRYPVDTQK